MVEMPTPGELDSLLQSLVSNLEDFVVILTDQSGKLISWHPGVQKLFGFSEPEFIGQHVDLVYTDEDKANQVAAEELESAAKSGKASDTRWLRRSDGMPVMVEGVTLALRGEDKQLLGFGKVLRDFTERKQTEDRLTALTGALELSSVIVRTWEGTIEHWTAGSERLYGFSAEEAVGANCAELLRTAYPYSLKRAEEALLTNGFWKGEVEQSTRDGRRLTVAAEWVLLRDEAGNPSRVIETQTDITDRVAMRKNLELAHRNLQAMAAELERSNEELSDFARIASHDLSAPLTSASWLVDLLENRHREQLDERGQLYLRQVKQSLDRMSDLMDGILAHARAGMSAIRTAESSEADAALTTAIEDLRRDLELSNAFIARDPLPAVPVAGQAMTQLFQNLISNAIKYRKPGQRPSIRITVTANDDHWLFAVRDNGLGIAPEWHERIFQPLQRLHDSSIAGSGIGLATCRKIVTRAGGRIWVESEPEIGSTFFFTLPKPASGSETPTPALRE